MPSLAFQICIELMYIPYTVSPYGHHLPQILVPQHASLPLLSRYNEDMRMVEGGKKMRPCCRGVVEGQQMLVWGVKDLMVVVRMSGLAGAGASWVWAYRIGCGGTPRKGYFIKVVLEPCWNWGDPLRRGFLDEEDGSALQCHGYMYEIWDGSVKSLWEALSWWRWWFWSGRVRRWRWRV